ncbi:conserved hypothetical protein [Neospora caninum Liverpool]|uniref:Uncharacterized protein n=1 Tax=Neospora caninum (strain Liverpool) TaxID=572307 RepID=F0VQK9_NEOCL|nr:conserved hypothetical protein [Neospora caninum Liverpool]CBZ56006.1 conserved hypothetical protein [Neospora caninum Liverpool]CEL70752.1 TPA: hypothetical protein BN1204_064320 [Neospora caninum Liverpool]|eukprot:XP_003886032.1 conserved hypothetical protein [Neospora caninum Liverpool]
MEISSRFSAKRTKEVSCSSTIDRWTRMAFDACAQNDVEFAEKLLGKVQTLYSQVMATGAEQRLRPGSGDLTSFSSTTSVSDCPWRITGRQIEDLSKALQSLQQKTARQQDLGAMNLSPNHGGTSASAFLPLTALNSCFCSSTAETNTGGVWFAKASASEHQSSENKEGLLSSPAP